jgi:hypothetical protein
LAKRSPSSDPWDVPIWFLVCAGSLAIVMAFAGWSIGLPDTHAGLARYEEALYRALSVNTLSDAYARMGEEGDVQNVVALRLLGVARWIGAVVFFLTLFKVVYRLFLENFLSWRCRNFWSDHIVIIGDRPIAVTEITTLREFYDFDAKYAAGGSRHTVPADLPKRVEEAALEASLKAHRALGCRGVTRSDFRYDEEKDRLVILETNTQPGMTPTSLVPEQAAYKGMAFEDLVAWMIEDASCPR